MSLQPKTQAAKNIIETLDVLIATQQKFPDGVRLFAHTIKTLEIVREYVGNALRDVELDAVEAQRAGGSR